MPDVLDFADFCSYMVRGRIRAQVRQTAYQIPMPFVHDYLRTAVWRLRKPLSPVYRALHFASRGVSGGPPKQLPILWSSPPWDDAEIARLTRAKQTIAKFARDIEEAQPWLGPVRAVYPALFTMYGDAGLVDEQMRCLRLLREDHPEGPWDMFKITDSQPPSGDFATSCPAVSYVVAVPGAAAATQVGIIRHVLSS